MSWSSGNRQKEHFLYRLIFSKETFLTFVLCLNCLNVLCIDRSSRPDVFGGACNFIKKETLAQVFSSEFCKISKNTFFYRTPLVAASALNTISEYIYVYISKNIISYTFLLVFKIVESLQCMMEIFCKKIF